MEEIELNYDTLFEIISTEEQISYKLDKEYFQETPIQVLDENNNWVNVKGLITKSAPMVHVEIDVDNYFECATTHLVQLEDETVKHASELVLGERLSNVKDNYSTVTNITLKDEKEVVYDIEVDSESHLYQIANGTIHHNTLLTSAIIKYANDLNMRTITIVPSSSLLKQTHDYVKQFGIPVGMFGGGKKDDEINMVCTWQTLQNNKPFIRDFECIIWDECHTAKAFVAMQIMNEAKKSFMRLGLTGTVPKKPLDKANLTAGFGPVVYDVKAHELQERNILSTIDINIFELIYPKEFVGSFIDWHDETMFLQGKGNKMYQKFMEALVGTLEGNTLILMKNIDPAEDLAETLGYEYISSKLKVEKRQEKFNEFVYGGNLITVGTYSLLSTGIDIVHINNLILAPTPGKSMIKTIQSIGRGLRRKGGQKEHVTVIDLTSNLKFDKKHIKERKEFYREAKYPFESDKISMEDFAPEPKK